MIPFDFFGLSTPDSAIIHYRFTCLVFGLRPSPAILGTVIASHVQKYCAQYSKLVHFLDQSLYVDDLVTGADTILLHKWKSILRELEYLKQVAFPRCLFKVEQRPIEVQIYGFSNASDLAFAAVLYMGSIYNDGNVEVRIIAAKIKVTPLKKQSIP